MPNGLNLALKALLTYSSQAIQNHPKRLTALIATLALGGAGGALVIASIASFAPDAADLQVEAVRTKIYRGKQVGTGHVRKQLTPCG